MTQGSQSYLDSFFGPAVPHYSGNDLPKRPTVEYFGCVVTDDPINQKTVITIGNSTLGPDGTSYAQITAPLHDTANPKAPSWTDVINTTTPSATAATIYTRATQASRVYTVDAIIWLTNGGAGWAKYKVDAFFVTDSGGVLTKKSSTPSDVITGPESSSSCDIAISASGTNIIIQGSGFSVNNRWGGRVFVNEGAF